MENKAGVIRHKIKSTKLRAGEEKNTTYNSWNPPLAKKAKLTEILTVTPFLATPSGPYILWNALSLLTHQNESLSTTIRHRYTIIYSTEKSQTIIQPSKP